MLVLLFLVLISVGFYQFCKSVHVIRSHGWMNCVSTVYIYIRVYIRECMHINFEFICNKKYNIRCRIYPILSLTPRTHYGSNRIVCFGFSNCPVVEYPLLSLTPRTSECLYESVRTQVGHFSTKRWRTSVLFRSSRRKNIEITRGIAYSRDILCHFM